MKVTFLLAKDPARESVGDTAMMRQLLRLVARDHQVSIICWSDRDDSSDPEIRRLLRPKVNPARIAARAIRHRRSLLHARFDDPQLRAAIDQSDADAFVAVHHYMAEAFLRSSRRHRPLYVVNVVSESPVWAATRRWPGRAQARSIDRDETRVIAHAVTVGSYDKADAAAAAALGARRSVWLELTLPPAPPIEVRNTPPRLAFLGDRRWAPNQRAWTRLLALWPEISAGIPDAELVGIGPASAGYAQRMPAGATDLGFVDDLRGALARCRALAAPIDVGGGVRVKLLEAAALGLPVVATTAAIGSLDELLGIEPAAGDVGFVAAARRLLSGPEFAALQGAQLHAMNTAHWESGRPLETVRAWLAP